MITRRRKKVTAPEQQALIEEPASAPARAPRDVGDALSDLFDESHKTVKGQRGGALKDIDAAILTAEHRVRSGEWDDADAGALLGLYAWCHRSVYGVTPVELEGVAEYRAAKRAVVRVLHDRFADKPKAVALFIKWSWKREKDRAAWAAANQKDRNRMGWRLQFSDRQVTDFRVAMSARSVTR